MRYVWLMAVVAGVLFAGTALGAVPAADFTATPTTGTAPLAVGFTDTSTNSPTSWYWSFGDGGSSSAQNPSHTFTSPRAYSVSLTASNADGTNTVTKDFYISVFGSGTTYYVAPGGSDNNPGTEAQPFATIQKGLDTVTAGGTLIVQDGTYSAAPQTWAVGAVRSTGTASDPIVIRAAHKWGAVIDGQNANQRGFYICGKGDGCAQAAQYVTIQGFEVKNCWLSSSPGGSGIDLDGYANHCVIRDNHIHHIANFPDSSSMGNDGSWEDQRCSYTTWDSNVIHDIGRTSGQVNLDHGIYNCGDYGTITNNTIYNCKVGFCVQIAGYYDTVDNLVVSNNTFADGLNRGHMVVWGTVTNTAIQNNIFYNIPSGYPAIAFSSARKNVNDVIRNNLTYGGTGIGAANSGWTYSSNITGDPLFADAANRDYHLSSGSPARDAGTASSAPASDEDGLTRPTGSGYDIGAFEYVAASGGGGNPPVANFTGNPTSGNVPLTVLFTDTSTNNPTSWAWTFGDGGTSGAQNPSHQYTGAGSFTVGLTATNAYGDNTCTKDNYITAYSGGGGDFTCASATVVQGGVVSGDHTSTHASDDVYFTANSVKAAQNKYWVEENYQFNTGLGSLSSLGYTVEGHIETNPNSITITVKAYNYATVAWDSVGTWNTPGGTTESTYTNTIANPSNYISSGTVQLKLIGSKGQVWQLAMDLVRITAQP